jgi:carbon storage regulator
VYVTAQSKEEPMLVLSRKAGESIIVGDNIRVTISRIEGNTVQIGIDAPRDVKVLRHEVADRMAAQPGSSVSTARALK